MDFVIRNMSDFESSAIKWRGAGGSHAGAVEGNMWYVKTNKEGS
jgi:hypothetical protein